MARTRGGHEAVGGHIGRGSSRGNSVNEEAAPQRRRPTASARRQRPRVGVVDPPAQDAGVEERHVEADIPAMEGGGDEIQSYPGGPLDCSVLTKYADHVAVRVWEGQEGGELKLASHGRKVSKFGRPALEIEGLVAASGLDPLISCSAETGDRRLLLAFVERWHSETSSFHLPVGELTITLDDVASLLHIPIEGDLLLHETVDAGQGVRLLVDLLEISPEEVRAEMEHCHGAYVQLSWLRDIYAVRCQQMRWRVAARVYLLHLVGCTLFANKSAAHIGVVFLEAFRDLEDSGRYA